VAYFYTALMAQFVAALDTGRADREIIDMGKRLGMNNFLKKPFNPEGLKAAIEAIVGKL